MCPYGTRPSPVVHSVPATMAVMGGVAWYTYTSQMSGFWNLVSTNALSV